MKDIRIAMAIEYNYLDLRSQNQDANLQSMLNDCGYISLEEYFADKLDFLLKSLTYNEYTGSIRGIPEAISNNVVNKQPSVFLPTITEPFLWHGSDVLDYNLCKEKGYVVLEMGYDGGTIVSGADDFSFGILVPESIGLDANYFLKKLQLAIPESIVDGNDLLINEKKVFGSMSFRSNDMFFFGGQLAIVDHTNDIDQLCNKKSDKPVGFFNTYDLDYYKGMVREWLQHN